MTGKPSDGAEERGGHVPLRTCIGCRQRAESTSLLRLAVGADRVLRADPGRCLPGRGAWVHRSASCLARALEEPVLNRAFRCRVNTERRAELMAAAQADC